MKPSKIFIIRHGFSESNENKNILNEKPDYAVELTPAGREQAFAAGREINEIVEGKSFQVYCSPFWRTRQTYIELRKSLNVADYREDPRIREQEFGTRLNEIENKKGQDRERNDYGHFYYRMNGGESGSDVYDRCSDFIGTMFRDFENQNYPENALIVTHGLTSRILLMRWLKMTVEEFEILKNPKNCQFFILELNERGKYVLKTPLPVHERHTHERQFKWE